MSAMVPIYVTLIIHGKRTFSSCPVKLKPDIRQTLVDLDLEYLIDE